MEVSEHGSFWKKVNPYKPVARWGRRELSARLGYGTHHGLKGARFHEICIVKGVHFKIGFKCTFLNS